MANGREKKRKNRANERGLLPDAIAAISSENKSGDNTKKRS